MKKKTELLKLVEKAARIKIEQDSYTWPPLCMGYLHQPKRPVKPEEK